MYGCFISCGSTNIIEDAIMERKKLEDKSTELSRPMDINEELENIVIDPTSTYSCDKNSETDIKVDENEEKKNNLVRMFRENSLVDIYYGGAAVWSPSRSDEPSVDIKRLNRLYELLVNKNMWLLIFDKMCVGFLIDEAVLRRIDYFNEFIQNDMIMDKTNDEIKNFGEYMMLGEEPAGAGIYIVRMVSEPYKLLLKNLTIQSVIDTIKVIRESTDITDYSYGKLDKDFMSTFFGFTSDTYLFKSFSKYLSEKAD